MKQHSLKVQLLRSLALPIMTTVLIVGALAFWSAQEEISEVYDSQLITAANLLWLVNRGNSEEVRPVIRMQARSPVLGEIEQKTLDEYARWRAFRVWKHNTLVITSDNGRPPSVPASKQGFTEFSLNGKHWRSFTLVIPEEQTTVEVAEKIAARRDLVRNILQGLILPLLFALPVIVYLIVKGIHWGLVDLRRFAQAVDRRSPDDPTLVSQDETPTELLPLVGALNRLLNRLQGSLMQERLFTDNAAHELRTPLAALTIQAQVVKGAKCENEHNAALAELMSGVSRVSRLIEQMLSFSRLRHQPASLDRLVLHAEIQNILKIHAASAARKRIALSLYGDEQAEVRTNHELLATLIGNLIDNAIKYTPDNGSITLQIQREGNAILLQMTDTGPGIPEQERENVFKRFYRLEENTQPGSGLGLAIARQIAEILHAHLTFFTPADGKGLGVELAFDLEYFCIS